MIDSKMALTKIKRFCNSPKSNTQKSKPLQLCFFPELVVPGQPVIAAPLDVSGDQVRAEPDVGKEALGDVGHDVDVVRLRVLGGNSKGFLDLLNHGLNHRLTHPQPQVAHL